MNGLKLYVVAAIAAVMMLTGANVASASGNRLGTLNITGGVGGFDSQPAHYRKNRRHYRKHRRYRRYGHRRHRHYYRHKRRHRHHRHGHHRYYGPYIHFGFPGFGFHLGH